jgi:hypothetical protein
MYRKNEWRQPETIDNDTYTTRQNVIGTTLGTTLVRSGSSTRGYIEFNQSHVNDNNEVKITIPGLDSSQNYMVRAVTIYGERPFKNFGGSISTTTVPPSTPTFDVSDNNITDFSITVNNIELNYDEAYYDELTTKTVLMFRRTTYSYTFEQMKDDRLFDMAANDDPGDDSSRQYGSPSSYGYIRIRRNINTYTIENLTPDTIYQLKIVIIYSGDGLNETVESNIKEGSTTYCVPGTNIRLNTNVRMCFYHWDIPRIIEYREFSSLATQDNNTNLVAYNNNGDFQGYLYYDQEKLVLGPPGNVNGIYNFSLFYDTVQNYGVLSFLKFEQQGSQRYIVSVNNNNNNILLRRSDTPNDDEKIKFYVNHQIYLQSKRWALFIMEWNLQNATNNTTKKYLAKSETGNEVIGTDNIDTNSANRDKTLYFKIAYPFRRYDQNQNVHDLL